MTLHIVFNANKFLNHATSTQLAESIILRGDAVQLFNELPNAYVAQKEAAHRGLECSNLIGSKELLDIIDAHGSIIHWI